MNELDKEVTPRELDCGFMFGAAALSLIASLILPFGHLTIWPAALAVVNFINGWRLYQKIKKKRNQSGQSDSHIMSR